MSQLLLEFQQNTHLKTAVYEFFISHLRKHAADLAVEGKDTSGIKDAKEAIDNAFNELEVLYGPKPKKTINNPAR